MFWGFPPPSLPPQQPSQQHLALSACSRRGCRCCWRSRRPMSRRLPRWWYQSQHLQAQPGEPSHSHTELQNPHCTQLLLPSHPNNPSTALFQPQKPQSQHLPSALHFHSSYSRHNPCLTKLKAWSGCSLRLLNLIQAGWSAQQLPHSIPQGITTPMDSLSCTPGKDTSLKTISDISLTLPKG